MKPRAENVNWREKARQALMNAQREPSMMGFALPACLWTSGYLTGLSLSVFEAMMSL
jgi:hypothetical protein